MKIESIKVQQEKIGALIDDIGEAFKAYNDLIKEVNKANKRTKIDDYIMTETYTKTDLL